MRINKFVALASGMSRRAADTAVTDGRVVVNAQPAATGQEVGEHDVVELDGKQLQAPAATRTIILNKPAGFVVSRDGQGSRTIYDLLPPSLQQLKPVGRLDKNSSGLLLLTNDGQLTQQLTHPSYQKMKVYEIWLSKPLEPLHRQMISDHGVQLEDGPSKLQLERIREGNDVNWRVFMHEGRNRQIRRTFASLGYDMSRLHRTKFGDYSLGHLRSGAYNDVSSDKYGFHK
jgi:23S rRNA pseudouridine2605 synthase